MHVKTAGVLRGKLSCEEGDSEQTDETQPRQLRNGNRGVFFPHTSISLHSEINYSIRSFFGTGFENIKKRGEIRVRPDGWLCYFEGKK